MTVQYKLEVVKDMRLLAYDKRLKTNRNLVALIYRNGLVHNIMKTAVQAAKIISKNPLVDHVSLTRVETSNSMIFRNGTHHDTNK